jgi:hypothetical protein
MFYNKTINIYIDTEPFTDEYGIVHKGALEHVDTLLVDVQPIDKLRSQKEFGIDISVSWRIFSPLNQYIIDGAYIEFKGKMYKILSVMEWDDYIEFLVGDIND